MRSKNTEDAPVVSAPGDFTVDGPLQLVVDAYDRPVRRPIGFRPAVAK